MNTHFSICPLSSGSSGNCILVRSKKTTILVDCGITGKACERELEKAGVNPFSIDAILVTHEHIDHIKGVGIMARRYDLPIYATLGTWQAMIDSIGKINTEKIRYIAHSVPFNIGNITVKPFKTSHDAQESVGFVFTDGEISGGIATDLGTVTREIYDVLSCCSILLIEANHDEKMLMNGPYSQSLKERILSDRGHLSNRLCGALCAKLVRESCLKVIILGHISLDNNTPSLAYECVKNSIEATGHIVGKDVFLVVANRSCISEIPEVSV